MSNNSHTETKETVLTVDKGFRKDISQSPYFEKWLDCTDLRKKGSSFEEGDYEHAEIQKFSCDDILLIIDMQKDLVPINSTNNQHGGNFAIKEGDLIIAKIIAMIETASKEKAIIIASRDYHPDGKVDPIFKKFKIVIVACLFLSTDYIIPLRSFFLYF